jgi:hypothetical protein
MFKKSLFVLLLAVALLTVAGFQAPTASACYVAAYSCSSASPFYSTDVPMSGSVILAPATSAQVITPNFDVMADRSDNRLHVSDDFQPDAY